MATALLSFEENILDPRLARSIWFMGGLMTVHADARETNGRFALIETSGVSGGEPPLHLHEREDELFYVLEGRLKVTRGSEELILEAGDSAFLPRCVPHTFKIRSDYARWLVYITPGGFEEYFRILGKPAKQLVPEPNPAPPDFGRTRSVAAQFGVSFLR
jgi:mannose-6-phosphate isomerase-like protein (cupin superfamily)